MTRLESNEKTINEIQNLIKDSLNSNLTGSQAIAFQLGVISTTLLDISRSLAILADKAESEEEE